MPHLALSLLGAFQAMLDGEPITSFESHKVRALLAYLAVENDRPHARETLAGLLWPDFPNREALRNLRLALSNLRQAIGDHRAIPPFLLITRDTIQFNAASDYTLDAMTWLLQTTVQSPILHSVQDSVSNLQSLVSTYRGKFLDGFSCDSAPVEEWLLLKREQIGQQVLRTLRDLTAHSEERGEYELAQNYARQQLELEPWDEHAHGQLMRALAYSGLRSAALAQYETCRRLLKQELGVEPSRETVALYESIRDGTLKTRAPTNVPLPLTSFVGRQNEMVEVKRLLTTTRLLTLTGAGGCGKTRLALQVATELAMEERFQHGVWWVDLAALSDPALVTQSVAMVFNLSESPGMSLRVVLTNYLRAKELLLVADNCEHLLDACAQLIGTLLSACPKLQIVATSREPLNISGETVWRVPSLALPDPARIPPLAQLRQYDAIQLFVERALVVTANWRLAENAAPVAQVCARLDGIPLAIELATARLKVLSAEQIATRLDDRFTLLTGGSRTALPRHQTLRATMDWSYDLLSDAERSLLRRLSVFAGGFSLEAIEAVVSGQWSVDSNLTTDHHPLSTVLDLLTALLDKSLIVVEQRDNATRYRLLETMRQYAREKLAEANESEIYARRHCDWFLRFAEQAEPHVLASEQLEWCERLERDMENLRAALTWSLGQTDHARGEMALRLARALAWFWIFRGYWNEAHTWMERALENRVIVWARAGTLLGLGGLEFLMGKPAKGEGLLEESLALYRQFEDKEGIAIAASLLGGFAMRDPTRANVLFEEAHALAQELNVEWLSARTYIGHGMFAHRHGDLSRASTLYASALDHARRSGNRWFIGNALEYWGDVALTQGDLDHAAALFTESLEVRRELGNKNAMANDLFSLGTIALRRQDGRQAETLYQQALALRREMGNTRGILECLRAFSRVAATEQRYEHAARLLGATAALREMLNDKDRRSFEEDVSAVRAQLGEAAFETARAAGRAMSLEQAIEYALENVETTA
ncbi:MAG: tetratricopeptide repeat protein [Chloroflexi bacterium]|nr:tetratricopeptide repeat protein [Chloroflexota bacterium]